MQARAYRDCAASGHLRDLLSAVALHIMQPHSGALVVRQRGDGLPQFALIFRLRRGGIGGGLFGPNHACTRAQIVTFLYKTYQGA